MQTAGHLRVSRTEAPLGNRQRSFGRRLGFRVAAEIAQIHRQVLQRSHQAPIRWPEDPFSQHQKSFVQRCGARRITAQVAQHDRQAGQDMEGERVGELRTCAAKRERALIRVRSRAPV